SDRKNTFRIIYKINNIILFNSGIGGTYNTNRLIKSKIYKVLLGSADKLSVHPDLILGTYFGSHLWQFTVNRDAFLLYQLIRCSSRAITGLTQIFIYSGKFFFHCQLKIQLI